MAKPKKYYVVWEGHVPGVYNSWSTVLKHTKGYSGAKYKSFTDKISAEKAFLEDYRKHYGTATKKSTKPIDPTLYISEIVADSIAVDAACSGANGPMEYQGVISLSKQLIFKKGPYENGTNNVGEFLALVHAMALLYNDNNTKTAIYSDSRTAMAWVRNKKTKTTLKKTNKNTILFTLISRAEKWLQKHQIPNQILKWDTKRWGEIPADFGRK